MPVYQIPEIVEVELDHIELPKDIPVDDQFTEKPLSACSKTEVDEALKAFSGLAAHSRAELENVIEKHIEIRRLVAHLQAYRENFDEIDWVRRKDTQP